MSRPETEDQSCRWGSAALGGLSIPVLVVLVLLASGIGFKVSVDPPPPRDPTPLRKQFTDFSTDFLGYKWRRVILDEKVEKVAGVNAYLKLSGFRKQDGSVADLYTSYVGMGTTMVEHEPAR